MQLAVKSILTPDSSRFNAVVVVVMLTVPVVGGGWTPMTKTLLREMVSCVEKPPPEAVTWKLYQ